MKSFKKLFVAGALLWVVYGGTPVEAYNGCSEEYIECVHVEGGTWSGTYNCIPYEFSELCSFHCSLPPDGNTVYYGGCIQ